ncbi:hypothetical protein DFH28DRAFT_929097 [Melampsora americana]|nr:hypothetical protein DFH28DRAFT_929097 [Melampsora americana]
MRRGQTQGGARITHAEKRYTRAKDNVGAKVAQGQSHGRAQVNPRLLRKPRTVTYSREANTTEKQIVHMGQGQADPENRQGGVTQGGEAGQRKTRSVTYSRGLINRGAKDTLEQSTSREKLGTGRTQGNPGDSVVCVTRRNYNQVMGVEVNTGPKYTGGPKDTQGPRVTQGGCTVQRKRVRVTYRRRETADEPRSSREISDRGQLRTKEDPRQHRAQEDTGKAVVCVTHRCYNPGIEVTVGRRKIGGEVYGGAQKGQGKREVHQDVTEARRARRWYSRVQEMWVGAKKAHMQKHRRTQVDAGVK